MVETSFGDRLRALRRRAGLTLEALAEASGVSARAISDMERGRSRGPQDRTLVALFDGLGLGGAERADLAAAARAARAQNASGRPRSGEPPRGVSDFVGREAESKLIAQHADGAGTGRMAPVVLIHGQGGLGKTALALHAGEELRARFPDGRCYLDLRGMDPTPLAVGAALRRLLQALGADPGRIATSEDEQASQLRAILAERRVLLLLDNAADETQVRPLLPGTGTAMTIVTSRRTLAGLEGVLRIGLAPLADAEAAGLLRTIGGATSRSASDTEIGTVARLCGNLPLALRIAGTRFASRPGWTMRHLIDRLADEERRLANLTAGDTGVAAAFALSYAQLTGPTATLFRRLALIPGDDFTAPLAAVLVDTDHHHAEHLLDDLADLGLLQAVGDRYRLHDLIRLYAAECLRTDETRPERDAARRRMLDALIDTAITAGRWYEPGHGAPPGHWRGLDPLDTQDRARAWLRAELSNWVGALRAAARDGQHQQVVDIAESMHWYSDQSAKDGPWHEVYQRSRTAAAHLPDRRQEITHINYLAWVLIYLELRYADGVELAMQAHRMADEHGDAKGEAEALWLAGAGWARAGDHDRSLTAIRRAIDVADAAGIHDACVQYLVSLGTAYKLAGRTDEAVDQYRAAIQQAQVRPMSRTPRLVALSTGHNGLLRTLTQARRWPEALAEAPATLTAVQRSGSVLQLSTTHLLIGLTYAGLGMRDAARAALTRALELNGSMVQPDPETTEAAESALAALDVPDDNGPAPPTL
ncbi:tetratricopeptide repeat protein [Micromonospora endolithica]|nr:tetratricopeptide repeat protein [Micromonospora endolithica]